MMSSVQTCVDPDADAGLRSIRSGRQRIFLLSMKYSCFLSVDVAAFDLAW